jgi:hypothetical protein
VYADKSWDVFEIKGGTEISLTNSLGVKSISIRDSDGKLKERKLIDENKVLIVHNRYIWKNDLLVQEIGLDFTRTFFYGNNPYKDTVKVIPSDKGYYFHKGYDGSVGMIPKKGDANYESYLANPYGIWFTFHSMVSDISLKSYVLMKEGYNTPTLVPGMPIPTYHNTPWSDTLKAECQKSGRCLPFSYNGGINLTPRITKAFCVCSNNKYLLDYEVGMPNSSIQLLQSFISWDMESITQGKNKKWMRNCLTKKEIQSTYEHEVKHYRNALNKMKWVIDLYIPRTPFYTHGSCEIGIINATSIIIYYMDKWLEREHEHKNPESPKNTGVKRGEQCDG